MPCLLLCKLIDGQQTKYTFAMRNCSSLEVYLFLFVYFEFMALIAQNVFKPHPGTLLKPIYMALASRGVVDDPMSSLVCVSSFDCGIRSSSSNAFEMWEFCVGHKGRSAGSIPSCCLQVHGSIVQSQRVLITFE
eukprot:2336220-Amphidinium_carterae.1